MRRGDHRHVGGSGSGVPRVEREAPSGASTSQRGLIDALLAYVAHHRASLFSTVKRLRSNIMQTLLTAFVVAIALALPALLMLALSNVQGLGQGWDTEPKLSVYLNKRVKPKAIEAFIEKLKQDSRVKTVEYISADDALTEFEQVSGFGAVLSGLESNPLPAVIVLGMAELHQSAAEQAAFVEELNASALVDDAVVDLQWVTRFLALTALAQKAVLFLAILLALGALLAIGNTVKLIIENRKEEIIVIKLVGGTNGFVRRPLLYTGGAYGFVGGLLACCIVFLVVSLLSGTVNDIAHAYHSTFELRGLNLRQGAQLVLLGTLLGWLGAVLAVGRHLSAIEPT